MRQALFPRGSVLPRSMQPWFALLLLVVSAVFVLNCGDDAPVAPQARCIALADTLDFGPVLVGSSRTRALTLVNTGGVAVQATPSLGSPGFRLADPDSGAVLMLAPGDSASLMVVFTPTQPGTTAGALTFGDDTCPGVALKGRGEATACSVEPKVIDFGRIVVGEVWARVVGITNLAAIPMETGVLLDSPDFRLRDVDTTTVLLLQPDELRTVVVEFVPTQEGVLIAELTFSGGGCSPVTLQGMGGGALCEVEPSSLDFGPVLVGLAEERRITVYNRSTAELAATVTTDSPEYTVEGDPALRIPGRGSKAVTVRFTPSQTGTRTAALGLEGSACPAILLTGAGESETCILDVVEVVFGLVKVGQTQERVVTVENTGLSVLETQAPEIASADFTLPGVSAGSVLRLEPGASVGLTVAFVPQGPGERSGQLVFQDGRCPGVTLRGEAPEAKTWRVLMDGSGDAPTVQAGIDSSVHGDVVLVGPGTYYETINLRGKRIHLTGEQGRDVTILDGSRGDDSVVVCESGETNETVIEGFTITGGKGRIRGIDGRYGAGVLCLDSTPIIQGNAITGNRAVTPPGGNQSRGGGILLSRTEGGPELTQGLVLCDNEIQDNFASNHGGGVYIGEPCTIEGNEIRGNRSGTDGGGIYMGGNKTLVRRNTILENIAGDHGGGIYIVNDNLGGGSPREVEVAENLIIENTSLGLDNNIDCSGGGIRVSGGAWVHHNTIIFNHAESIRFPAGGGICLTDTRSGTLIENNLIYGCNEGGVVAAKRLAEPYEAVVRRNLLFGNGQMEIYNEDPEWWRLQLEENVFENPLLCIDGLGSEGTVAENSPALTQPWGVIGATAEPGCGPVGIVRER